MNTGSSYQNYSTEFSFFFIEGGHFHIINVVFTTYYSYFFVEINTMTGTLVKARWLSEHLIKANNNIIEYSLLHKKVFIFGVLF